MFSHQNSLIEMGLGDGEEAAVSIGFDGEDEWFPSQDRKLPHKLSWVGNEQAGVFLWVYLPLVHMKHPRNHKANINILEKMEEELNKIPKDSKAIIPVTALSWPICLPQSSLWF